MKRMCVNIKGVVGIVGIVVVVGPKVFCKDLMISWLISIHTSNTIDTL